MIEWVAACVTAIHANAVDTVIVAKSEWLSTCHVNITQHHFDAPYDQCYCVYVGEDKQKLWMNRPADG